MKLISQTMAVISIMCLIILAEFCEASLGKKFLKWLIKRRRNIMLYPMPFPLWLQRQPPVEEATFSWHHRGHGSWSPDYYPPLAPPPYPDDYMYPYP